MRTEYCTDIAIANSGSFRGGEFIPNGPISFKALPKIFPVPDTCIQLKVSGSKIIEALNHGVSQYPSIDGRFPAVSGLSFKFDSTKSENNRVMEVIVDNKGPL